MVKPNAVAVRKGEGIKQDPSQTQQHRGRNYASSFVESGNAWSPTNNFLGGPQGLRREGGV